MDVSKRKRPRRTGAHRRGAPASPLPLIVPEARLPQLKVPKKETRNVELRGQARMLQALTAGINRKFPNALPVRTFVEETSR